MTLFLTLLAAVIALAIAAFIFLPIIKPRED